MFCKKSWFSYPILSISQKKIKAEKKLDYVKKTSAAAATLSKKQGPSKFFAVSTAALHFQRKKIN